MELIVLIAVLVFMFALVYWKNVRVDIEAKKATKQPVEVEAKLEFFSDEDGWHAVFYKDEVLCYGVFMNLSEGQVTKGVTVPAVIEEEPTADNEFYLLKA